MSHLTKNKIIVYLAAIFLVGGVTGAVLGWTGAKERWWHPPDGKTICDRVRHRLQSELNLRPDQVREINPILEKRAKEMDAIHSRTIKEIEEIVRSSNERIVKVLDSPQRTKFEEMEKKRQESMRNRFKPPQDALRAPDGAPKPRANDP